MSTTGLPPIVTPPPPDALRQKLGPLTKVRTRRPWLAFSWVALISLCLGALPLAARPLRPDLPWLPAWWVASVGVAWLIAFAVALARALVPARGQVLPDGRAAERTAAIVILGVVALTLLWTRDAGGHSFLPTPFIPVTLRCLRFELLLGAGVTVIALVTLRRLLPLLSWRLGAAIGAAGGALGGLTLHFECPYAAAAHVVLGHAGGVALGALLGAALARLLIGRASGASPLNRA